MTRAHLCCLVASLIAPVALAGQSGSFVVRLGNDTLGLERYTRSADRLEGEQVWRTPVTVHRIFTATFGRGGKVDHFELVTHNVTGGPGPAETKATLDFSGDSAISVVPQGDSTVRRRAKIVSGALPFYFQNYALVEEVTRRARAARGTRYRTTMVQLGGTEPWNVEVNRVGADSMTLMLGQIGPLRARVDSTGTLLGLTGVGSTVQVTVERTSDLDLTTLGKDFAARSLGPLSPADSVQATIGDASLSVHYSRPSVRGRTIFGGVVPWNQVWRTGANEATLLETSADLVIGGTPVPAGKYSLWTIPGPRGWKLIINKNTGQWGTEYAAQHDLVRLDMTVEPLGRPVEQFTIAIEPQGDRGVLNLDWARTRAWIPISRQ